MTSRDVMDTASPHIVSGILLLTAFAAERNHMERINIVDIDSAKSVFRLRSGWLLAQLAGITTFTPDATGTCPPPFIPGTSITRDSCATVYFQGADPAVCGIPREAYCA